MKKSVSFFGDEIENNDVLGKVKKILSNLIENENVSVFLFGEKSFVEACGFSFGSQLKQQGKDIKFIIYDEKHDLNNHKFKLGKVKLSITDVCLMFFDEIRYYKSNEQFEKNKQIVDDSDFCIFSFNENDNLNFLISYAKAMNKIVFVV